MNIQNTVNSVKQGFLFDHNFGRDQDLARSYLEDFESGASEEGYLLSIGGAGTYKLLAANEALLSAPHYKRSQLTKMKKSDLYGLCDQFDILNYYYSDSNYEDNTKGNLIDELMKYVTNEVYYRNHFEQSKFYDLDHDLKVNGYCQGEVILFKFIESKKDKLDYKPTYDYLQNLYFNSPIYCHITVYDLNGDEVEEIFIDDYVGDIYDFDKSDVLNILEKHYSEKPYYKSLSEYVEGSFDQDANWY